MVARGDLHNVRLHSIVVYMHNLAFKLPCWNIGNIINIKHLIDLKHGVQTCDGFDRWACHLLHLGVNMTRLDVILHEVNIGNEVHHCNNFNQLFQHNLEKVVIENIEIIGFKVWRIWQRYQAHQMYITSPTHSLAKICTFPLSYLWMAHNGQANFFLNWCSCDNLYAINFNTIFFISLEFWNDIVIRKIIIAHNAHNTSLQHTYLYMPYFQHLTFSWTKF